MEALKSIGWWALLLLAVVAMGWILYSRHKKFTNKVEYSVKGEKGSLGFKPEWWGKHWDKVFALVVVIAVVVFVVGCTSGSSTPTPPPVAAVNCQGSYVGSYGPPERDERIRLRNTFTPVAVK
jgi:ABC-type Fe3+ transport system permease subunit